MAKKHILICDDEIGIRESLNLILKDDYDITLCNNGKECFNLLETRKKFDLLLLSIKQSDLSILKSIIEKIHELKVIVITDYKKVDIATEAIKVGAVDYVIKPFSSKEILNRIEKNL